MKAQIKLLGLLTTYELSMENITLEPAFLPNVTGIYYLPPCSGGSRISGKGVQI